MIIPKYYNILLVRNKNKKIPKLDLYQDYQKNIKLEEVTKKIEKINKKTKRIYNRYQKELTPEQRKRKDAPLIDFFSNNHLFIKEAKKIGQEGQFTNAFRKLYEIYKKTKLIDNFDDIRHFDICTMPGAFVLSSEYYVTKILKKKYDWYGQSFITNKKGQYFEDKYGVYKNNEGHLLVGIKGDITLIDNIEYYRYFFKENKRNLITSDCGLSGPEVLGDRERQMLKIFMGQFISGVTCLEKGGHFIMKFYVFSVPFIISMVYLMGLLFEEVRLNKPESSRQPRGTEIYLICYQFKDNLDNETLQDYHRIMENLNLKKDHLKNIVSSKDMDSDILQTIEEGLIKYNSDFADRLEISKKEEEEAIGYDMFKETEAYLAKRENLTKEYKSFSNRYIADYIRRMKYKKK